MAMASQHDPTSSLAAALHSGSVYTALSHLDALNALPSAHTSAAVPHHKLLKLLRCVLPLLLLPRALARYDDASLRAQLLPLVASVFANARGVRAALPAVPAAQLRAGVAKAVRRLSHAHVDDASAALAQAAATISEQLCDAWGTMLGASAGASATELASDLLAYTSRMRSCVHSTNKLDVQVLSAHRVAIDVHHAAARLAHSAVQLDIDARQSVPSYQECRARELIARGSAMSCKLQTLCAQIRSETYTTESVRRLRLIATEVCERQQQVERELRVERGRLAEYRALGVQFERIVREVLRTRQMLEQKEWSRKELALG